MLRSVKLCLRVVLIAGLAGCASDYSPDTYSGAAVQQANKVEPGIVVGFRQVSISANGTVGAVTGGAAGGILGAQVGPGGFNSALGTVGGSAIGSILGSTVERFTGDTTGWEYIVRKPNGDLLSLTQREPKPLPVGQKVLVITGSQARIVPDYSVTPPEAGKSGSAPEAGKPGSAPEAGKEEPAKAQLQPAPAATPVPAQTSASSTAASSTAATSTSVPPVPAEPAPVASPQSAAPIALTPQSPGPGAASQSSTAQSTSPAAVQSGSEGARPTVAAPAGEAPKPSADAGSPFQMVPPPVPVEPQHGPV